MLDRLGQKMLGQARGSLAPHRAEGVGRRHTAFRHLRSTHGRPASRRLSISLHQHALERRHPVRSRSGGGHGRGQGVQVQAGGHQHRPRHDGHVAQRRRGAAHDRVDRRRLSIVGARKRWSVLVHVRQARHLSLLLRHPPPHARRRRRPMTRPAREEAAWRSIAAAFSPAA